MDTLNAAEAKVFYVPLAQAGDIAMDQDHMTMTLQHGWVSSRDSFLMTLFSKKSKLAIGIDGTVLYFDGDKSTYSKLLENTDINPKTDRPWGAVLNLMDAVPADASPSFAFKLSVYRDDRLGQILTSAKGAEPPTLTTQIDLWVGYGNLLSALLKSVFDTGKTNYPFILTFDVKASSLPVAGKIKEHYEISIAPNKDGDSFLAGIDATKLNYNEGSQNLMYNGNQITDHSYAVVKITKAPSPDITQLLLESKAPWAVLAVTQFLGIATQDVQNKDQIIQLAKNQLTQLKTELDLLKNEHRFSKYDRAEAILAFAKESETAVSKVCTLRAVTTADCPTADLDQFIAQIKQVFGLPVDAALPRPGSKPLNMNILRQQVPLFLKK
jgi:hypothetical protein